jgi:hypothetical protein
MTNLACQIVVLLITNFSPASVEYNRCPDCGLNYIGATKPANYNDPGVWWAGHWSWRDHSRFIKTNQIPKSVSTQTWAVVKLDDIEKRVKMKDSDDDRFVLLTNGPSFSWAGVSSIANFIVLTNTGWQIHHSPTLCKCELCQANK